MALHSSDITVCGSCNTRGARCCCVRGKRYVHIWPTRAVSRRFVKQEPRGKRQTGNHKDSSSSVTTGLPYVGRIPIVAPDKVISGDAKTAHEESTNFACFLDVL